MVAMVWVRNSPRRVTLHVNMVSRADYDAHIAELKARGQVGSLDNGRAEVAGAS